MPKDKKPTKTQTQIKHLNNAVNAMHHDLLRQQDLYVRVWNTLSIFTRTFQEHMISTGAVKDAEEFMQMFKQSAADLFAEAKAHNDAELARVKAEQAAGVDPKPAAPAPASELLTGLVQAGVDAEGESSNAH